MPSTPPSTYALLSTIYSEFSHTIFDEWFLNEIAPTMRDKPVPVAYLETIAHFAHASKELTRDHLFPLRMSQSAMASSIDDARLAQIFPLSKVIEGLIYSLVTFHTNNTPLPPLINRVAEIRRTLDPIET